MDNGSGSVDREIGSAAEVLVQDWMTPNPVAVSKETCLPDAHKLMTDYKIRRLPVLDGDKLVGVVTLGDIRAAEASEASSLSVWELTSLINKLTVERVMSREVITASPAMTLAEVAQLMLENKIAGLPVMSGETLVGIITESDIFRMLVQIWKSDP